MVAKIELGPNRVHILHSGDALYFNPLSEFLLRDRVPNENTYPDVLHKEIKPQGSHSSVMLDLGKGSVMSVSTERGITYIQHLRSPAPSKIEERRVGPGGDCSSYEAVDNGGKLIAKVTHLTPSEARRAKVPYLIYPHPVIEVRKENVIHRARRALGIGR